MAPHILGRLIMNWDSNIAVQVHGVPVEVIQVSVVFRRLQMVVLLDLTMACTLSRLHIQYTHTLTYCCAHLF